MTGRAAPSQFYPTETVKFFDGGGARVTGPPKLRDDEYLRRMVGERVRLAHPMDWPGMTARGSNRGVVCGVTQKGLWRIRRDGVRTVETWLPDFWEWDQARPA